MHDTTTPESSNDDGMAARVDQFRDEMASALGVPVAFLTPTAESNPHAHHAAESERMMQDLARVQAAGPVAIPEPAAAPASPIPVCGACGRERTLADDYDYTPMQLVRGRPLGWFNGDGEQMCGECLTLTMRGQLP